MNPPYTPLPGHDAIRLTGLPAALQEEGYITPDYRVMREAAVNGLFPAHQRRGIWHFHPADLPAIAAALRLATPAPRPRGQVVAHGAR